MKSRLLVGLCLIFLLVSSAQAITKSYETSSVSRIVGDSPQDLTKQLQGKDINLRHTTLFRGNMGVYTVANVLQAMFGPPLLETYEAPHSSTSYYNSVWFTQPSFNFYDKGKLNSFDFDQFEENELLIIGGQGKIDNEQIVSKYISLYDIDPNDLSQPFENNKPLLIHDSNFAGITIPNINNLEEPFNPMISLFKDSTVIAPTFHYSPEFVRAFVCNIKESGRSVGETFRRARNNYHWGTTNEDETIGLTLMSYQLLGNPLPKLNYIKPYSFYGVPQGEYCQNYLADYERTNDLFFNIMSQINASPGASPYVGKFTYRINDYDTKEQNNFTTLTTPGSANQEYLQGELVLPKIILASPYPLQTIFRNITLISIKDPVEIIIENLPSWDGENFIKRICEKDSQPASVNFAHSFTEDREAVLIEINPVEVVNCTTGELKLYQTIEYDIDYIPYSPILIEQITHESNVGPGETTEIEVTLKNVKSHAVNGKLIIKDEDDNDLKHQLTSVHTGATKKYKIQFEVPQEQGLREFKVEYYENENKKTQSKFLMAVSQIIPIIDIPLLIQPNENLPVDIILINNGPAQDIDYTLEIKEKDHVEASHSDTLNAGQGENTIQYIFDTQGISYGFYTLEATFSYNNPFNNATETLTKEKIFLIISTTPTPPTLHAPDDVTIKEGERVTIQPTVRDINGDPVTLEFKSPARSDGIFQTKEGDQGTYDIEITASDGEFEVSDSFTVTVEDMPLTLDETDLSSDSVSFLSNGGRQAVFLRILKKADVKSATMTVSGSSGYQPQNE
ncbi:MAG: hypothetical protein KAT77_03350 [Nanoarchaeota archaeon]|nr:hypothetical protein [Nanoarchaeota archaeon]